MGPKKWDYLTHHMSLDSEEVITDAIHSNFLYISTSPLCSRYSLDFLRCEYLFLYDVSELFDVSNLIAVVILMNVRCKSGVKVLSVNVLFMWIVMGIVLLDNIRSRTCTY